MTYTAEFGVVEQEKRFSVDCYAYAKTEKGAWSAFARALRSNGIEEMSEIIAFDTKEGTDPAFNNNDEEYRQEEFLKIEQIDDGRFYCSAGVRKERLSPDAIQHLSIHASIDADYVKGGGEFPPNPEIIPSMDYIEACTKARIESKFLICGRGQGKFTIHIHIGGVGCSLVYADCIEVGHHIMTAYMAGNVIMYMHKDRVINCGMEAE